MNAMLESYRNSCNQLTIRISELSQQIQQTCSQTEADCLNSRKHLLQTERLELLRDMQDMQPYERVNVHEPYTLASPDGVNFRFPFTGTESEPMVGFFDGKLLNCKTKTNSCAILL